MKRLLRMSVPVLVLGLPQCTPGTPAAGTAPAPASSASSGFRIDYVHETLPNGLNVIYHVDRSSPIVAVNTW